MYTVCQLYTRRPDDCLAQKEGFVRDDDPLFPQKARYCQLTTDILGDEPRLIHLIAVLETVKLMNDWQSAFFKIVDGQHLLMMFLQTC